MAIKLTSKIVAIIIVLVVAAAVTTTVVLLTRDPDVNDVGDQPYLVGVGIADMTGPVVEITFVSLVLLI